MQGLDAQLVISLGGGSSPNQIGQLPGNPIVVSIAPQLELLSRAAPTITHAGLNTALESLSFDVPMVAIPVGNDRPGVAARLKWVGAAEFLPSKRLQAQRLQLSEADGVQRAVRVIELVLNEQRAAERV